MTALPALLTRPAPPAQDSLAPCQRRPLRRPRWRVAPERWRNVFGSLERYERWIDVDAGGTCFAMTAPDVLIARVAYRNDPYGRRIERVAEVARPGDSPDVQLTRWAYADALNPIAELDESGEVRVRYVYATHAYSPDAIIEYPDSGGEPVYHQVLHDPRGSIRGWISLERAPDGSASRTLHEHAEYDPWGLRSDWAPAEQLAAGATRPRELTSLGFAGGIYDPITGLVRFGARDYDPRVGRWTAKDPIGFAGGDTLLYGYVGGDPVNGVDPTGLWEVEIVSIRRVRIPVPLAPQPGGELMPAYLIEWRLSGWEPGDGVPLASDFAFVAIPHAGNGMGDCIPENGSRSPLDFSGRVIFEDTDVPTYFGVVPWPLSAFSTTGVDNAMEYFGVYWPADLDDDGTLPPPICGCIEAPSDVYTEPIVFHPLLPYPQ